MEQTPPLSPRDLDERLNAARAVFTADVLEEHVRSLAAVLAEHVDPGLADIDAHLDLYGDIAARLSVLGELLLERFSVAVRDPMPLPPGGEPPERR